MKGFTLIELLVVIAIIGVLAATILSALDTSRNKGVNGAIRQNLANTRPQAGLYFNQAGYKYYINASNNACLNGKASSPKGAADMVAAADLANGSGNVDCNVSVDYWAVAAQLVGTDSNKYFCTDSNGFAGDLVGTVGGTGANDFLATDLVCK